MQFSSIFLRLIYQVAVYASKLKLDQRGWGFVPIRSAWKVDLVDGVLVRHFEGRDPASIATSEMVVEVGTVELNGRVVNTQVLCYINEPLGKARKIRGRMQLALGVRCMLSVWMYI